MMESSDKIASINIDPSPERQMRTGNTTSSKSQFLPGGEKGYFAADWITPPPEVGKDADESWEKLAVRGMDKELITSSKCHWLQAAVQKEPDRSNSSVTVAIYSARGIQGTEGLFGIKKWDTFVRIDVADHPTEQTEHVENTADPVWNQLYRYEVENALLEEDPSDEERYQGVIMTVFCHNNFKPADYIGKATLLWKDITGHELELAVYGNKDPEKEEEEEAPVVGHLRVLISKNLVLGRGFLHQGMIMSSETVEVIEKQVQAQSQSPTTSAQIAEAERKAAEKAEAERIAAEKAEAERIAAEKAEAERLAAEKTKAERVAAEKTEAERIAAEKAEAERIAAEKAEAERIAAEKAEAAKKAEAKRVAAEKAEAERIAADKAEAERIAAEKAEGERIAAEKAEADRIAAEKADAERIAAEKDEAERIAAEKAEASKKADAERIAAEKAETERIVAEKAEAERAADEQERLVRAQMVEADSDVHCKQLLVANRAELYNIFSCYMDKPRKAILRSNAHLFAVHFRLVPQFASRRTFDALIDELVVILNEDPNNEGVIISREEAPMTYISFLKMLVLLERHSVRSFGNIPLTVGRSLNEIIVFMDQSGGKQKMGGELSRNSFSSGDMIYLDSPKLPDEETAMRFNLKQWLKDTHISKKHSPSNKKILTRFPSGNSIRQLSPQRIRPTSAQGMTMETSPEGRKGLSSFRKSTSLQKGNTTHKPGSPSFRKGASFKKTSPSC